MGTLVSLVGQRPGATATVVKTMGQEISHVLLLPTKNTENESHRIRDSFPTISVEESTISLDPTGRVGNHNSASDTISRLLDSGKYPSPFYYDISPGLNYQVALIAHHLRHREDIVPLYADHQRLHNLTTQSNRNLASLSLETLAKLHGYDSENDLQAQVERRGVGFKALREQWGRLYILLEVTAGPSRETTGQVRKIVAALSDNGGLSKFHPFLAVWANINQTARRLEAYGIRCIRAGNSDDARTEWNRIIMEDEPQESLTGESPMDFASGRVEAKARTRKAWRGEKLVLALGSDPSSTLLALATHQPEEAAILVDAGSHWVRVMAARLKKAIEEGRLLVGKASFWPSNLRGELNEELKQWLEQGGWKANVSPGSKGFSWHLARLDNVELWSLNDEEKCCTPLLAGEPHPRPLPYDFPKVAPQAMVVGGELRDFGTNLVAINEKMDPLYSMAWIVSNKASARKDGGLGKDVEKFPGKVGDKLCDYKNNFIEVISSLKDSNGQPMLELGVNFNKADSKCYVSGDLGKGHWLEEVVAVAFLQAGEKQISDMRVSVKWKWLGHKRTGWKNDMPRDEIDVILVWQGQYIAVECKNFLTESDDINAVKAEMIARTKKCLGCFALPVLVRGGIPPNDATRIADESVESQPLEIGLSLLNQPNTLKTLIEKALKENRTISE